MQGRALLHEFALQPIDERRVRQAEDRHRNDARRRFVTEIHILIVMREPFIETTQAVWRSFTKRVVYGRGADQLALR